MCHKQRGMRAHSSLLRRVNATGRGTQVAGSTLEMNMDMTIEPRRQTYTRGAQPERALLEIREMRERLPEQLAAAGLACLMLGAFLARISYRAHAAPTFGD